MEEIASAIWWENAFSASAKIQHRLPKLVTSDTLHEYLKFTQTFLFQYLYSPCQKLYWKRLFILIKNIRTQNRYKVYKKEHSSTTTRSTPSSFVLSSCLFLVFSKDFLDVFRDLKMSS